MADFCKKNYNIEETVEQFKPNCYLTPREKKLNSLESINSNKIKVSKRLNYPNLLTALCVCLKECDFSVRYLCENTITQLKTKTKKKTFSN